MTDEKKTSEKLNAKHSKKQTNTPLPPKKTPKEPQKNQNQNKQAKQPSNTPPLQKKNKIKTKHIQIINTI